MTNTVRSLMMAMAVSSAIQEQGRISRSPVDDIGDLPFVYINIGEEGDGLRFHGGTQSECDCILKVLGEGKVVPRQEFIDALHESGAVSR